MFLGKPCIEFIELSSIVITASNVHAGYELCERLGEDKASNEMPAFCETRPGSGMTREYYCENIQQISGMDLSLLDLDKIIGGNNNTSSVQSNPVAPAASAAPARSAPHFNNDLFN